MAHEESHDSAALRAAILDLEEPIMELRDGIRALLAINPNVAVGEAGIHWVAGKLQEAVERLADQWRGLLAEARSPASDTSEASPF